MPDLIGQVLLGRYHVAAFLGRGGMAEVYQAWDSMRAAQVAIKVLNQDLAEDFVFLRRFAREARALQMLDHPNIVRCFGFEQAPGTAYLIMEYIEGMTLRRYMHLLRRPFTLPEALYVVRPVCSALFYAHQKGIYHCDIKPANVFIERGGRVVLADFGVARLTESATMTASVFGTPAYMSPEQCMGRDLDGRADIYSLAITTYELLTLDRPFKGHDGTTGSRAEKVRWEQINAPPVPPRQINPHIPPAAETALLRALAKEPHLRPQETRTFYEELSLYQQVPAAPGLPPVVDPEAATAANMSPVPSGLVHVYHKRSPNKGVVAAIILGGLTLLLLLAVGILALVMKLPSLGLTLERPLGGQLVEPSPTSAKLISTRSVKLESTATARPIQTVTPAPTNSVAAQAPSPIPSLTPTPSDTPTSTPTPQTAQLRLVYVVGNVGSTDIYLADADGRNRTRVAGRACDEAEPAWSPDGQWIIYQSDCDGNYDIWAVPSDGGTPVQLTTTSNIDEREPDWSTGGDQIVFRSNPLNSARNNDGELWVMSTTGDNRQRLDGNVIMGRSPVWSPDGQSILFMSERTGLWQIYVYDLGSNETRRLTNCQTNCRWPCWAPDGRSVAYHSTVAASGGSAATADAIWFQSLSGGSPTLITNQAHSGRPSWSENNRIIFNSDYGIEVIDVSGGSRGVLLGGEENWAPCWSH